jgi:hypothetical protein
MIRGPASQAQCPTKRKKVRKRKKNEISTSEVAKLWESGNAYSNLFWCLLLTDLSWSVVSPIRRDLNLSL